MQCSFHLNGCHGIRCTKNTVICFLNKILLVVYYDVFSNVFRNLAIHTCYSYFMGFADNLNVESSAFYCCWVYIDHVLKI